MVDRASSKWELPASRHLRRRMRRAWVTAVSAMAMEWAATSSSQCPAVTMSLPKGLDSESFQLIPGSRADQTFGVPKDAPRYLRPLWSDIAKRLCPVVG